MSEDSQNFKKLANRNDNDPSPRIPPRPNGKRKQIVDVKSTGTDTEDSSPSNVLGDEKHFVESEVKCKASPINSHGSKSIEGSKATNDSTRVEEPVDKDQSFSLPQNNDEIFNYQSKDQTFEDGDKTPGNTSTKVSFKNEAEDQQCNDQSSFNDDMETMLQDNENDESIIMNEHLQSHNEGEELTALDPDQTPTDDYVRDTNDNKGALDKKEDSKYSTNTNSIQSTKESKSSISQDQFQNMKADTSKSNEILLEDDVSKSNAEVNNENNSKSIEMEQYDSKYESNRNFEDNAFHTSENFIDNTGSNNHRIMENLKCKEDIEEDDDHLNDISDKISKSSNIEERSAETEKKKDFVVEDSSTNSNSNDLKKESFMPKIPARPIKSTKKTSQELQCLPLEPETSKNMHLGDFMTSDGSLESEPSKTENFETHQSRSSTQDEISFKNENPTLDEQSTESNMKDEITFQDHKVTGNDHADSQGTTPFKTDEVESKNPDNDKLTASPKIPTRPVNSNNNGKEKPKLAPPKPKKLSSRIAAFQQQLFQPQKESREKESTIESSKTKPQIDIKSFGTQGIPLPGMFNPLQHSVNDNSTIIQQDDSNLGTPVRRTRGPKGKRLPKSIKDTKIEFESGRNLEYGHLWDLEVRKTEISSKSTNADESVEKSALLISTPELMHSPIVAKEDMKIESGYVEVGHTMSENPEQSDEARSSYQNKKSKEENNVFSTADTNDELSSDKED